MSTSVASKVIVSVECEDCTWVWVRRKPADPKRDPGRASTAARCHAKRKGHVTWCTKSAQYGRIRTT